MSPRVSLWLLQFGLWTLPIPAFWMVRHIVSEGGSWWWWAAAFFLGFVFDVLLDCYVQESYRLAIAEEEEA